jgi:DNA-binding transcriptional MocR family regulator
VIEEIRHRLGGKGSRDIADAVSQAIRDGAVKAGQRLPPIRTVAAEFGVSPSTISSAWAILARSGLVHADGRRGTVISQRMSQGPVRYQRALQYSAQFRIDLSTGLPVESLLPDLEPALRRLKLAGPLQTYLDQPLVPALRDQLHTGWPFAADAITVADGAMDALDLIISTLLRFGDRVAVERLTDPPLLDLLEAAGVKLIPVELDADGPTAESVAAALAAGARTFFLQPRAHHPTGIFLTEQRAAELSGVLRTVDALVVEIDFVGMVATAEITSLGRHIPDRTLHIRGYSTSHGPELRLAAVGGPTAILETLIRRRHLGQGWTSRLLQLLLLDLLTDSTSIDQVARARQEYARRRTALRDALAGHGIEVGPADGLYLWLPVANETAALVALASQGIGVAPGAPFSVGHDYDPHLCVTAGALPTGQAGVIADALAAAARTDEVTSGLGPGTPRR